MHQNQSKPNARGLVKQPNPENMSVEFDPEKRRTTFVQWGPLNKESALQSFDMLYAAEGFDPSYDTITDYREIVEIGISPQDIRDIVKEVNKFEVRTGKCALIIGNNIGRLALAKLFCEMSAVFNVAPIRYKAFSAMEKAEAWLDSK